MSDEPMKYTYLIAKNQNQGFTVEVIDGLIVRSSHRNPGFMVGWSTEQAARWAVKANWTMNLVRPEQPLAA